MKNWIPWLIGGGVVLAGGVALAAGGSAPCDPRYVQPRPLPLGLSAAALRDASLRSLYQLNCLGYGPVTMPANPAAPTSDEAAAIVAAGGRFAHDHLAAIQAYGDPSIDSVAIIKAIDDAYRARVGVGRASDYAVADTTAPTSSGSLALRRARALRRAS